MNTHKPAVFICKVCGADFINRSGGNAKYCSDACRRKAVNEQTKALKEARSGGVTTTMTVVMDPDAEGGFKPGNKITNEQIKPMLKNHSFTHGTILRDAKNKKYRVVNRAKERYQVLEAIGKVEK